MWLVYLLAMAAIDLYIYANKPLEAVFLNHLINLIPCLIFLGLAYSKWPVKHANLAIPVMILLISVVPILSIHLLATPLPRAPLSNIEGTVLRQLPILFIGLVLVSWNYRLVVTILFNLGTNILELLIVFLMGQLSDPRLESFYFITIIRTVCFVVVGVFISQLVTRLHVQQEALISANSRLVHHASTLENLTVSRERNRMSRELHDTVVHTLSGLSVQLETTKAYLDVDPDTARKLLDHSLEATRSGLQETRRAIKALRASSLEDLGLIRAIRDIVNTAAQRGQFAVEISLPAKEFYLPPDVEQCIYRITQEAVENVVHHANAQHLHVALEIKEKDVELFIRDDGIGFNPDLNFPSGHFGVTGIRERAQMVGGDLKITSEPGWGTAILLAIKGCVE
jgi:signal transduction histidine kinase